MKKQINSASVYYFIQRSIESCVNDEQLQSCERMIENVTRYCFASELLTQVLIKRCELLIQWHVYE